MHNMKKLSMFLKLAWKASPSYIVFLIFNTLISSGQILINIFLPKLLIDELLGSRDIKSLIYFSSLIIVSNLVFAFLNNWMKKVSSVQDLYMTRKLEQSLSEKIMKVEFSYLENPHYLDLKERASFAILNQGALYNLIITSASCLKNIVTLVGIIAIIFTLSWVLFLLLITMIIVSLFIYSLFMRYQVNFFQEIIPVNRKYGYYLNLGFDNQPQKDFRLYSMTNMLSDKVVEYNSEINTWFKAYYKKQGFYLGLYNLMSDIQATLSYAYVGLRVFTDKLGPQIGLGSFTMYVSAALNFTKTTNDFGLNLIYLAQMLRYLDPFVEFMELPDEDLSTNTLEFSGEIESIEFKNVSFSYPGSDKLVLDNISFFINKKEKISIVGLNGAGKTTLIKLLCRLYRPNSGEILVNGHNIFEYNHSSYMKEISAVFQDFKLFAFSLEENITCKEINSNKKKTMKIIEEVGLKEKINSLPNGIESMYGKSYDENGIDLSGGESQKIAIARALYKNSSLVILDEPTSALDPLAEADIYENFNSMVGDKTAIYISHRMSSSMFCDKILIIENGKISDFDTHKNLMQKTDSTYYKLFTSQAENYQTV